MRVSPDSLAEREKNGRPHPSQAPQPKQLPPSCGTIRRAKAIEPPAGDQLGEKSLVPLALSSTMRPLPFTATMEMPSGLTTTSESPAGDQSMSVIAPRPGDRVTAPPPGSAAC